MPKEIDDSKIANIIRQEVKAELARRRRRFWKNTGLIMFLFVYLVVAGWLFAFNKSHLEKMSTDVQLASFNPLEIPEVMAAYNEAAVTGVPEYGADASLSFDDPLPSLDILVAFDGGLDGKFANETTITLTGQKLERYNDITENYRCEYCCGPAQVAECGCRHAASYRGLAKYLLAKHGREYSNDDILAAMDVWKKLWFPKISLQKALQGQVDQGKISENIMELVLNQ